jgi:predicted HTH domain antitoxin
MWINQQLENVIDAMERGHTSLRKASRYWNIMLTLFLYHLNGRIEIKKVGP